MLNESNTYPRTRSRGVMSSPANAVEYAKNVNCSTPSYFHNYTYPPGAKLGETEVMNDYVTPGFHRRSQAGEVIMTPMTKYRTSSTSTCTSGGEIQTVSYTCGSPLVRGLYDQRGDVLGYMLSPTAEVIYPDNLISDADIASMFAEAGTQCRSAHAANSKNDLVESAAQAYALGLPLISRAKSVHLWLNKFERLVQTGHDTASAWLTLRYGLMPLIGDMSAILRGMSVVPRYDRQTFRGYSQMRLHRNDTVVAGPGIIAMDTNRYTTDHVDVRCTLVSEVLLDGLSSAGLTAGNLIALPWNLIPYSFVADWFANIGDVFQASMPTLTSNILGSCTVTKRTQVVEYLVVNTRSTSSAYTITKPGNGKFSTIHESISRVPYLSSPEFVIRSDFRLNNLIRIADAMSLLATRVGTVFRDPISGRRRK